jgi:hypothetical protein
VVRKQPDIFYRTLIIRKICARTRWVLQNQSRDPGFVDRDAFRSDVRLKDGSPMIDADVRLSINGIPVPLEGNAPDIGTREKPIP